jgi:hypothetical protein
VEDLRVRLKHNQQTAFNRLSHSTQCCQLSSKFRLCSAFPLYCPDLTPLDFAIFEYLKGQVFKRQFNDLEELQKEITRCSQVSETEQ